MSDKNSDKEIWIDIKQAGAHSLQQVSNKGRVRECKTWTFCPSKNLTENACVRYEFNVDDSRIRWIETIGHDKRITSLVNELSEVMEEAVNRHTILDKNIKGK